MVYKNFGVVKKLIKLKISKFQVFSWETNNLLIKIGFIGISK